MKYKDFRTTDGKVVRAIPATLNQLAENLLLLIRTNNTSTLNVTLPSDTYHLDNVLTMYGEKWPAIKQELGISTELGDFGVIKLPDGKLLFMYLPLDTNNESNLWQQVKAKQAKNEPIQVIGNPIPIDAPGMDPGFLSPDASVEYSVLFVRALGEPHALSPSKG